MATITAVTVAGNLTREWSRAGARCRPLGRSVSPTRSPNRTCDFHRIRLSTSPAGQPSAIALIHPSHGEGIFVPR